MSRGWVWDFSSITAFLHCWQHFTKHLKFNYPSFSNQKCFWNVFPTPLPACVADVLCSSSGGFTWLLQRRKVLNGAAHLDFSYASLCSAMRIWKQIEVVTILKNTSESQWFLESSEFWRQKKKKKKHKLPVSISLSLTLYVSLSKSSLLKIQQTSACMPAQMLP